MIMLVLGLFYSKMMVAQQIYRVLRSLRLRVQFCLVLYVKSVQVPDDGNTMAILKPISQDAVGWNFSTLFVALFVAGGMADL